MLDCWLLFCFGATVRKPKECLAVHPVRWSKSGLPLKLSPSSILQ